MTTVEERDYARMSENLGTTIWRLRETVRVAKLAATHRLGQMRSLLMHERHKVWKREFSYDRIETAAEMDEKRSRSSTSPVSNPFFYRNMVIPEHPHTSEEFNLQMKVDVEGLRMEIILSPPLKPRSWASSTTDLTKHSSWGRIRRLPCLKKNLNAPRPSEHPPVWGKKMSKRLGGINS